jgi:hypothetical protein
MTGRTVAAVVGGAASNDEEREAGERDYCSSLLLCYLFFPSPVLCSSFFICWWRWQRRGLRTVAGKLGGSCCDGGSEAILLLCSAFLPVYNVLLSLPWLCCWQLTMLVAIGELGGAAWPVVLLPFSALSSVSGLLCSSYLSSKSSSPPPVCFPSLFGPISSLSVTALLLSSSPLLFPFFFFCFARASVLP